MTPNRVNNFLLTRSFSGTGSGGVCSDFAIHKGHDFRCRRDSPRDCGAQLAPRKRREVRRASEPTGRNIRAPWLPLVLGSFGGASALKPFGKRIKMMNAWFRRNQAGGPGSGQCGGVRRRIGPRAIRFESRFRSGVLS